MDNNLNNNLNNNMDNKGFIFVPYIISNSVNVILSEKIYSRKIKIESIFNLKASMSSMSSMLPISSISSRYQKNIISSNYQTIELKKPPIG